MKTVVDKKLLNNALKGFLTRLEKTEKFALEQAPEICQQMVTNGVINSVSSLVAAAAFFFLGSFLLWFSLSHQCIEPEGPTRYFFVMLLGGITATVGFCVSMDSIVKILYLKKCTKLFLLKEFRDLLKNEKAEE